MPISILAVGRMAKPLSLAAQEYEKRLSRYDRIELHEIREEREPEAGGEKLIEHTKRKEGERILKYLSAADYLVALTPGGEQMDSEAFAARLQGLRDQGKRIVFCIGGSLGLSQEVLQRADERLSLSRLTFPHQLARVVLLEQLYRAFKILSNERYHK